MDASKKACVACGVEPAVAENKSPDGHALCSEHRKYVDAGYCIFATATPWVEGVKLENGVTQVTPDNMELLGALLIVERGVIVEFVQLPDDHVPAFSYITPESLDILVGALPRCTVHRDFSYCEEVSHVLH